MPDPPCGCCRRDLRPVRRGLRMLGRAVTVDASRGPDADAGRTRRGRARRRAGGAGPRPAGGRRRAVRQRGAAPRADRHRDRRLLPRQPHPRDDSTCRCTPAAPSPYACPARAVPVVQVPLVDRRGRRCTRATWCSGDDDGMVVGSPAEVAAALDQAEAIQRREEALREAIAAGASLFDHLNYDEHLAGAQRRAGQQVDLLVTIPWPSPAGSPGCGRRRSASCCASAPIRTSSPSAAAIPIRRLFPVAELQADLRRPARGRPRGHPAVHGVQRPAARCAARSPTRLSRDGMACTADDVLIIQGGQQGLDLAAKLVVDPGDVIITENPTFLGALIAFAPTEPRYAPVRTDDGRDGHRPPGGGAGGQPGREDDLHGARLPEPDRRDPEPAASAAADRAGQRVRTAGGRGHPVPGRCATRATSLPTLKSLDTEGRVLHLGSFSKILAPSMRLGWAVGRARRSWSRWRCSSWPRTPRTAR